MKNNLSFSRLASLPTIVGVAVGVFAVVAVVQAATTISTDIQTDGALSVTGLSSLTTASTSGAVSIAGNLWVGGNATTTASSGNFATKGTLAVTGASTLTGGVTVGSAGSSIGTLLVGTCAVTPGAIGATASTTVTCSATGVAALDKVFLTPPSNLETWFVFEGATSTTNQITIQVLNSSTTASITGIARPWSWMAVR